MQIALSSMSKTKMESVIFDAESETKMKLCETKKLESNTLHRQNYSKKRQVFVPNGNMVHINLLHRRPKNEHSWPLQADF